MIKADACKLSRLVEKHYKRELNIPYIMEGQRKITLPVSPGETYSPLVTDFETGKLPEEKFDLELVQEVLDDMCRRGIIKEGEYLISFDD